MQWRTRAFSMPPMMGGMGGMPGMGNPMQYQNQSFSPEMRGNMGPMRRFPPLMPQQQQQPFMFPNQ